MTVREAIAQAKKLRPVSPEIDDALLLRYINKTEGIVQTEILRLSAAALTKYTASDMDAELIVPAPYDDIYPASLMAMIDLSVGEAGKYNNDQAYFNQVWSEYTKWFARNHTPGTAEMRGFFITAYGLAVKHGYTGTEEAWLLSLKGERGWGVSMRYSAENKALQWCSLGDNIWNDLVTLAEIQGDVVSQTLTAAQNAKMGAEAAQAAAEAAQTAAEAAKASAETAKTGADTAAANAGSSAGTAGTKASEASASAATGSTKAADAALSADAAATSESAAASSASVANTKAGEAASSASAAASSAGAAAGAKTAAEAAQQEIENMTASVKALAEGASPAVEKTVSGGVVNLDFGIPKGDTGATGAQGDQGYSVASVYKKSGTGVAGTTDVYGVKINDANQSEVGTFNVYQGANGQGSGDMLKTTYDTDNDGVVDNAEKLGGQLPAYYAAAADLAAKASSINGNAAMTDIVDADYMPLYHTSAAAEKKTLWSTIKSTLKTYFDTLYAAASALTSHTGNTSNPHSVTASQVGLGSVPNVATNNQTPTYSVASTLTALASGEVLSTAFGKIAKAISSLISHLANTSNPHSVTAAQVGADPTGTAAAAVSAHNTASNAHSDLFALLRLGWKQIQVYTVAGTYTYTVPDLFAGKPYAIAFCLIGAGGGGGTLAGNGGAATGGGSGCIINKVITVTPGSTISIVVGAGGTKATSYGSRGVTGGTTSLVCGGISLTALGGGGGTGTEGTAYTSGAVVSGGRCSDTVYSNNNKYNSFSGLGTLENILTTSSTAILNRQSSVEQSILFTGEIILLPGGGTCDGWGSQTIPNNHLNQTGSSGNSGTKGTAYGCGGCGGKATTQNADGADGAALIYALGVNT